MLFYSQFKINTDVNTSPTRIQTSSFLIILQGYNPPGIQQNSNKTKTPLHACITTRRLAMLLCGQICKSILSKEPVMIGFQPFQLMAVYYKYQKGSLVTRMMQSGMPEKVSGTNK